MRRLTEREIEVLSSSPRVQRNLAALLKEPPMGLSGKKKTSYPSLKKKRKPEEGRPVK